MFTRKVLFLLIALMCISTVDAGNRAMKIRKKILNPKLENYVLVVCHRADWRHYPENSIEGIESCIRMGADMVEIDVQRTKDGVLVLMHDGTIDRKTDGKGKVSDMTLAEIKQLRLKQDDGTLTNYRVPTLEEALLTSKDRIMVNLDKADRYFDQVYEILQKTGTTKQVVMKGGSKPEQVKAKFGKYLKEIIYMPIVTLYNENAEQDIETFLTDMKSPAFELLFKEDGTGVPERVCKQLKGRALTWYNILWHGMCGPRDDDDALPDPDAVYGYLIKDLRTRIIQTDRPTFLLSYLRLRGWHE